MRKDFAMCFRPPEVDLRKKCPQCGAENPDVALVCERCGAEFPDAVLLGGVSGAPSAPKAPGTPKAPGIPKAPYIPKGSSASAIPPVPHKS